MTPTKEQRYTVGHLVKLYADVIGDAIISQPVGSVQDGLIYDVIDVWWQMCKNFGMLRTFGDMTRRKMSLQETVLHVEKCKRLIREYYGGSGEDDGKE